MSTSYQWDFSVVFANGQALLQGLAVTLLITFYAIVLGSLLGAAVAYAKGSTATLLKALANGFTDVFRAIPVLVTMIWLFYSWPSLTQWAGFAAPIRLDPQLVAVIALGIYLAAQVADILRTGLDAIATGQYDVATTLGMRPVQVVRYIQIPQVLRLTFPAILGQYASTLLLSSLASVIAVNELLHQAQNIITNQYHALEVYTAVALLYLTIAWPITILTKKLLRTSRSAHLKVPDPEHFDAVLPKRMPALELLVDSLAYVAAPNQIVLEEIKFQIKPGNVLGVFGPSGAGKSTLIRLLAGLKFPSRGSCSWSHPGGTPLSPKFGYVPQGLFLWPHLTAIENVELALHVVERKSRAEARNIASHWLQLLGLTERIGAKTDTLSGGEAQRVAIARALAMNPEVMLFDEITSSLDPELIAQIIEILTAIVKSGTTVIIVSHHVGAIYPLIDKALFLSRGRQVDFGTKAEVFSGRKIEVRKFISQHALWESLPRAEESASPAISVAEIT